MANDHARPVDGDHADALDGAHADSHVPPTDGTPRAPAVARADGDAEPRAERDGEGDALRDSWCVGSQDVLFETPVVSACDACGGPLPAEDDEDEYAVAGHGVYLWARGDDVRFESVPLCPACASAIGVTALARIEIEEEEG